MLRRDGGWPLSGVEWLDGSGEDPVLVRTSRALGLPPRFPDIHGLALRVPTDAGHADVLLATTGLGRVSRFLLTASKDATSRPFTTLLPYRTPRGPVLIGAMATARDAFELQWASSVGEWVPFGRLQLAAPADGDPPISFDPVVNHLPGLEFYPWVQLLREPAYRSARRRSDRAV